MVEPKPTGPEPTFEDVTDKVAYWQAGVRPADQTDITVEPLRYYDLEPDEKDQLKRLQDRFLKRERVWNQKQAALVDPEIDIKTSIEQSLVPCTWHKDHPYDMLVALKQRIARPQYGNVQTLDRIS